MVGGLPTALSIAGSDSSGGAGIQADLRTFAAMGVWGMAAVTAVTAQSSRGVRDVVVIPAASVSRQIECALEDSSVAAAKTGMLATAEIVETVADAAAEGRLGSLVVDPVIISSSGHRLLEDRAVTTIVDRLLPLCRVFTPNIPEAERFLGTRIASRGEMEQAARRLAELGPAAVLLKGGHLQAGDSPDFLWQGGEGFWLEGSRLTSRAVHGTGCTLSAAITAGLARSGPVLSACRQAKSFVADAILGSTRC
jgi:hydroxymethylpyrimidine kinase/phosphomethylpyrimidine kinase